MWAPLRSGLCFKHFIMEMACTWDGALVCMFFDEFRGLNTKLYCWVWVWAALEFSLKGKKVVQSIALAKHAMRLASFGTVVHQCVVSIEWECSLEQADRCVMLWCSQCYVCVCLNVNKKDNKWILSSTCLLTILFCVFAFAEHVGFLRMVPLLCLHQHKKGGKRW